MKLEALRGIFKRIKSIKTNKQTNRQTNRQTNKQINKIIYKGIVAIT